MTPAPDRGMVEIVARSLCRTKILMTLALSGETMRADWLADRIENGWPKWEDYARAAIEAMQEPTPEIVEAIDACGRIHGGAYVWRKAIDAALSTPGDER